MPRNVVGLETKRGNGRRKRRKKRKKKERRRAAEMSTQRKCTLKHKIKAK